MLQAYMMRNKRSSRTFPILDLLYKSCELDSEAIAHYWSQQLLNANEIQTILDQTLEKTNDTSN